MKHILTILTLSSLVVLAGCQSAQLPGYTTNQEATNNTNNAVVEEVGNDNVNSVTQINDNTNTNEDVVSDTTEEEIDTSDWLTYTNEEYGFSFRYPNTYIVSARDGYKGDFTESEGIIFVFQQKDITSMDYPVRIVLFEEIIEHPTANDINIIPFAEGPNKIGEYFDHVISETLYSVNQYSGKMFRVKDLSGTYPVDDDHKLKDVGDFYYLDSNARTVLVHLTDGAAKNINPDALLNSLQF